MKTQKSNNGIIIAGAAIAIVGGLALMSSGKKKEKIGEDTFDDQPAMQPAPSSTGSAPASNTPAPVALNGNKLLKVGVTGPEVAKLQRLLGVDDDGIFGTKETEPALFRLKGVRETTLNKFGTLPNVNLNPLAAGVKVMAATIAGAKIFGSTTNAQNLYMSTGVVEKTITYGQLVGTIRSWNTAKTWYSIYYDSFFGGRVGFVAAADVKKV